MSNQDNKFITLPAPAWEQPREVELAELRQHVGQTARAILNDCEPGVYIVNHPTGVGKTTACLAEIARWESDGCWPVRPDGTPQRVIYLARNNLAIEEARKLVPFAFWHRGRTDDPASPAYCIKPKELARAADLGHKPVDVVCMKCTLLKGCKALKHALDARKPSLVMAFYDTYLNFGDRLDDFDLIIIDEEMTARLWREFKLTKSDLTKWIKGMNKATITAKAGAGFPDDHPARLIVESLFWSAGNSEAYALKSLSFKQTFMNLIARLRDDYNHSADVLAYMERIVSEGKQGFTFESANLNSGAYRMFWEVVNAIMADQGAIMASDGVIKLGVPLRNVIDQLSAKKVINLDATPNIHLIDAMFGDRWRAGIDYLVNLNIHVTQYCSTIYPARYMPDGKNLADIKSIISSFIGPYRSPLIVGHKDFLPVFNDAGKSTNADRSIFVDHPGATYIHFGHETRSLNSYQGADAVFIVGHWLESIDSSRLKVGALRRDGGRAKVLTLDTYKARKALVNKDWEYQIYYCPDVPPGTLTKARRRPDEVVDQDPLTLFTIDHSLASEVIQAIGRARPLNRATELPVYVINGAVYEGLPVHRFVTRAEIFPDLSGRPHCKELHRSEADECRRMVMEASESGCKTVKAIQEFTLKHYGRKLSEGTIGKYRPR